MATRYLEGARASLQQQADRLFSLYRAEQLTARGLRPGDSLDVETVYTIGGAISQVLPLVQARTTAYVAPIVESEAVAALPVDDWAQAQHGQGGVNVAGHKSFEELPEALREMIRPSAPLAAASLIGSPRGGRI